MYEPKHEEEKEMRIAFLAKDIDILELTVNDTYIVVLEYACQVWSISVQSHLPSGLSFQAVPMKRRFAEDPFLFSQNQGNVQELFKLDTGAQCNVLPKAAYDMITTKPLQSTSAKLHQDADLTRSKM